MDKFEIIPIQSSSVSKTTKSSSANLATWNPPTIKEFGTFIESQGPLLTGSTADIAPGTYIS